MNSFSVFMLLLILNNYPRTFGMDYDQEISMAEIIYYKPIPGTNQQPINILDLPEFNIKEEIKVIVHGYIATRNHPSTAPIVNGYLTKGYPAVFFADWSKAAAVQYLASRYFVDRVGFHFARILDTFLRKHNLKPENLHLIGHSLGAHVVGNIGRYFNGTIGRITGLDPALPLFNEYSQDSLRPNNARFVDVIHSGAPVQGDLTQRGHIDFYPNNGVVYQPGCKYLDVITLTSCSHYRAPIFFAESIRIPDNFPSIKCSLDLISKRKGNQCYQSSANQSKVVVMMGEEVSRRARGIYFLETSNVPPYGLGIISKVYKNNIYKI